MSRFCVDCKHHLAGLTMHWCMRNSETLVNLITGKPETVKKLDCEEERRRYSESVETLESVCAIEGFFFQPKE